MGVEGVRGLGGVSGGQGGVAGELGGVVDARVRVFLLGAHRLADVQDLGVVPLPGLPLPKLPRLRLDPGEFTEKSFQKLHV